jgi:dTDP-4-dehydrorhamnose reductase
LVNGIWPKNLSLAANKVNATLVHYLTDYVFNGETSRAYTIAGHPDPISRYGESKLLGEQEVKQKITISSGYHGYLASEISTL